MGPWGLQPVRSQFLSSRCLAKRCCAVYGEIAPDEERLAVRISLPPFSSYCSCSMYTLTQFLDKLYELGCNHWDTADAYNTSEDLIGKW